MILKIFYVSISVILIAAIWIYRRDADKLIWLLGVGFLWQSVLAIPYNTLLIYKILHSIVSIILLVLFWKYHRNQEKAKLFWEICFWWMMIPMTLQMLLY